MRVFAASFAKRVRFAMFTFTNAFGRLRSHDRMSKKNVEATL